MKPSKKHLGTLDDMSPEQKALVGRIKEELKGEFLEAPEMKTTWHILRFLRARDFHYEKAKAMILECLRFRKRKNFKRVATTDIYDARMDYLRQNYTAGHYGTDYEGRVVIIERVPRFRPENIFKNFTFEEIEDYLLQLQERMMFIELPISSMVHKRRVDHHFLIVDLKDVNVLKIFRAKFKAFVNLATRIGQDYYPEMLGKSFFVNTPLLFKAIWAIISLWLDKHTIAKFEFESGDGLKKLATYLDVARLPVELGGKNETPLTEGFGPWRAAIQDSNKRQSFFLADRSPEYEYYYTPEERAALAKKNVVRSLDDLSLTDLQSKSQEFKSSPVIMDLKVSNFRVALTKSQTLH